MVPVQPAARQQTPSSARSRTTPGGTTGTPTVNDQTDQSAQPGTPSSHINSDATVPYTPASTPSPAPTVDYEDKLGERVPLETETLRPSASPLAFDPYSQGPSAAHPPFTPNTAASSSAPPVQQPILPEVSDEPEDEDIELEEETCEHEDKKAKHDDFNNYLINLLPDEGDPLPDGQVNHIDYIEEMR